jgi:hypothetical protein
MSPISSAAGQRLAAIRIRRIANEQRMTNFFTGFLLVGESCPRRITRASTVPVTEVERNR